MNRLSVVLPNFNHAHFLDAAIRGLFSQSYTPDEIIIVDDGSTDDSAQIIERWAQQYSGIKPLFNMENKGVSYSLNRGIRAASGDWIFCPSVDDRFEPNILMRSLIALSRFPSAGLCSSITEFLDGSPYRVPKIAVEETCLTHTEAIDTYVRRGSWITAQSVVFKRSAMLEFGLYDEALGHCSDGYLIKAIIAKYGCVFIPEVMSYWRRDPKGGGLSAANDIGKSLSQILMVQAKLRKNGVPEAFLRRYWNDSKAALLNECLERHPELFTKRQRFVAKSYLYLRSKL